MSNEITDEDTGNKLIYRKLKNISNIRNYGNNPSPTNSEDYPRGEEDAWRS